MRDLISSNAVVFLVGISIAGTSIASVTAIIVRSNHMKPPSHQAALPSPTPSETATPAQSPNPPLSPTPSVQLPAGPPSSFSALDGIKTDNMLSAHGFLYVQVDRSHSTGCGSCYPVGPLPAEYMEKIAPDGTLVSRIDPWRWLKNFLLYEWMTADDHGVWITGELLDHGKVVRLGRTQATHDCPSITPTGSVGAGAGVLIHLDANTDCPTETINFTDPRGESVANESGNPGYEYLPTGLAYVNTWLWIESGNFIYGIDPSTGVATREQGVDGTIVGAAFGSLWINHPTYPNGTGHAPAYEVIRVDTRTATITGRFTPQARNFPHGTEGVYLVAFSDRAMWWMSATTDYKTQLVRLDLSTNKTKVIVGDLGALRNNTGGLAYFNGKLFVGQSFGPRYRNGASQIIVFDASTGGRLGNITTNNTDYGVMHLAVLRNTLFTSLTVLPDAGDGGGLWWIDARRSS